MAQVQPVVLTIEVQANDFEKRIKDAFNGLTDAEQKAVQAFDKVNQKVAAQGREVEKLIAREDELKAARVRAQDPKLVESINKELAKTQATLKGLSNIAVFDDSNIRRTLSELNAVQNKAAELRASLNSKQATNLDTTQRAKLDLDLSGALSEIERLKTEIKSIDGTELENSIRGSLSEFAQLNDETRAFALNLTRASDSGKQLADELQAIDRLAKGAAGSTKSLEDAIDDAQKPMQGLRNIGEAVRNTLVGAFAVELFQNFSQGLNQLVVDFQKLDSQVQLLFDRTADKSIEATSRIQALQDVTGESAENILRSVNSFAKVFELPVEQALTLIEKGFSEGANVSQEFLDILREYPEDFKRAGLSAQEFIKINTVGATAGIFSDRLPDSLREIDIRLNEARSGTGQLLNAFKLLGTEAENSFKKKIKDPAVETIDVVKLLFDEARKQGKDVNKGEFLALAFGIGGEEAKRAIAILADYEKETVKVNQTFLNTLKATQDAKQAQNEFAASIAPVVAQFKLLAIEGSGFIFSAGKQFIEFARESPELLTAVAGAVALNTFNVTALAQRTIALTTAQSIQIGVTTLLTRAQQALNNAIRTNPLGLILSAAGFVAVALKELYDRNETFRKSVDALGAGISKAFAPVVAFVRRVVDAFGEFAERARLAERVSTFLATVINNNIAVFSFFGEILFTVGKALASFLFFIPKLIVGTQAFASAIEQAGRFFTGLFQVIQAIPPGLAGVLNALVKFASQSSLIFSLVAESAREAFKGITSGNFLNFDRAKALLTAAVNNFTDIGSSLSKAFNEGYEDYLRENPLITTPTVDKEKTKQEVLAAVGPGSPAQKALDDNPLEIQARIVLAGGEDSAAGLQKQFEAERTALIKSEDFKRLIKEGKKKEADAVLFALEKSFLEKVLQLNIENQTKINENRVKSIDAAERNANLALLERLKAGEVTQFQFEQRAIEIKNQFNAQRLENEFEAIRAIDKINSDFAEREKEAARLKFKDEKELNIQLEKIDKDLNDKRTALSLAFNEKAAGFVRERTQTEVDEAKRINDLRLSVDTEGFEERQKLLNTALDRQRISIQKNVEFLNERLKGNETKAARERLAQIQENYNKQIALINDATGTIETVVTESAINVNKVNVELADKREQAVVESYQRELENIQKIQDKEVQEAKGNAAIIEAVNQKAADARVNAATDAAKKLEALRKKEKQQLESNVNLQGDIFDRLAALAKDFGKKEELTAEELEERKRKAIELTYQLAAQSARNTAALIGQLLANQDAAAQKVIDRQIEASNNIIEQNKKALDFVNQNEDNARGEDKRRLNEEKRDIQARIALEENKIKSLEEQKKKADDAAAKRKKTLALIEVAIGTAVGIAEATRQYAPLLPASAPLFATVLALIAATGATQAALIASQPLAKGTLSVEGGKEGKDSVPALLMPGEAVIPTKQARKHRNVLEAVMKDKVTLSPFINETLLRPVRAEINNDAIMQTLSPQTTPNIDMEGLLEAFADKLSKQKILQFNLDKRGFSSSVISESTETEIINKKYSTR